MFHSARQLRVMQVSLDTYMISTSGHLTTDLATLKEVVFRDANAFAKSKNKVMVPLTSTEVERTARQNPAFELQFRLADSGDASAVGVQRAPRPDISVDVNTTAVTASPDNKNHDLAENVKQLEKLATLKQQGILTEAVFQDAKRKILNKIE